MNKSSNSLSLWGWTNPTITLPLGVNKSSKSLSLWGWTNPPTHFPSGGEQILQLTLPPGVNKSSNTLPKSFLSSRLHTWHVILIHAFTMEIKQNIEIIHRRAAYHIKSIGIIKSIPVLVSKIQINDTFNDTLLNDINKHKAILTQKWNLKK